MQKTIIESYCDRCGKKYERRNTFSYNEVSYTEQIFNEITNGIKMGSHIKHKDKEFCGTCSELLHKFFNPKYKTPT